MTLYHPTIKKKIADWQEELRMLTENDAVILTCYTPPTFTIEFADICKIICETTGVSLEKVRQKTRKREVVVTRQLIAYYGREYTDLSLVKIGKIIGGKDHTTVLHSWNKVMEYLHSSDSYICDAMAKISDKLQKKDDKPAVVVAAEPPARIELVKVQEIEEPSKKKRADKETRKYYHTGKLHI